MRILHNLLHQTCFHSGPTLERNCKETLLCQRSRMGSTCSYPLVLSLAKTVTSAPIPMSMCTNAPVLFLQSARATPTSAQATCGTVTTRCRACACASALHPGTSARLIGSVSLRSCAGRPPAHLQCCLQLLHAALLALPAEWTHAQLVGQNKVRQAARRPLLPQLLLQRLLLLLAHRLAKAPDS